MIKHIQGVLLILLIGGLSGVGSPAQPAQNAKMEKSPDCLWRDMNEASLLASPRIQKQREIVPEVYRTVRLNRKALTQLLAQAPMEFTEAARTTPVVMTLPMPDGTFAQFRIQETQVMSPGLARQLPEMRTYSGHGIDDPTATVRCDWSPTGFHAVVLSTGETVYVEPYRRGDTKTYISYYKKDLKRNPTRRRH